MPEGRETTADAPCRCHQSWAYISPIHEGHCCFHVTATCHPQEVAVWEQERDRRRAHA